MNDIRFSNATNAYQDALRAAERIIAKAGASSGEIDETQSAKGASFMDMVGSALKGAEALGYKSEEVATKAVTGKASLADVITAVSSAENALSTVVAVRDKVIGAYQEIIRMPI
jgi:flagellar hook-basal body complex protein FliE